MGTKPPFSTELINKDTKSYRDAKALIRELKDLVRKALLAGHLPDSLASEAEQLLIEELRE